MLKIAYDAKVISVVSSLENVKNPQSHLDKLYIYIYKINILVTKMLVQITQ